VRRCVGRRPAGHASVSDPSDTGRNVSRRGMAAREGISSFLPAKRCRVGERTIGSLGEDRLTASVASHGARLG